MPFLTQIVFNAFRFFDADVKIVKQCFTFSARLKRTLVLAVSE